MNVLNFIEKPKKERQDIMNNMNKKELKKFIEVQMQFIVDFVVKRNLILKVEK